MYHGALSGSTPTTIQDIPKKDENEIKNTNGSNFTISLF